MTLTFRHGRTWLILIFAGLLTFPAPASPAAAAASRRARARAAYERAKQLREQLAPGPADTRLKAQYERVIRYYRAVHWHDPSYSKTPVALAAVGDLYAEMGRRFSSEHYFQAAIKAYEYLIGEYPQASMSRDALFAIGEIYRTDLNELKEARRTFQQFLEKYPRTRQAAEARQKLAQIARQEAKRAAEAASKPAATDVKRAATTPEVTGIRRWVGRNYTRIVVSVEGEVKFETLRLPNPDRIVLDLHNSRLSSDLVGKSFPVENGFLRQVRVGQYQPTITRVVLDVEKIEDYSIFSLPNPFRLVIDINGPPSGEVEVAEASKSGKAPAEQAKREAATRTRPAVLQEAKGQAATKAPGRVEVSEKESAAKKTAPVEASSRTKPAGKTEATEVAKLEPPPPIKPAAPTATGARTLTRALGLKIARIVIDPGHGGHDTGTIGPTGLTEKEVVLDVATRLKELVGRKAGAEVVMTRSHDTFVPLEERTAVANEKAADLFISIHANASRSRTARGVETYYLNFTTNPEALEVAARENATSQESVHQLQNLIQKIALTEKVEESQEFAVHVQKKVHATLRKLGSQQRDRGVRKAPFVVLIGANMPSILAEISFLTNPNDERLLKRSEHRQRIAEALYNGIVSYVDKLGGIKATQQASARETSPASTSNF